MITPNHHILGTFCWIQQCGRQTDSETGRQVGRQAGGRGGRGGRAGGQGGRLEISLAHPWSKSVLAKAARNEGAAASKRENGKDFKICSSKLPGVEDQIAYRWCMNTGNCGVDAESFLKLLSKWPNLTEWCKDDRDFRDFINHWQKGFAVILKKCNTRLVPKKPILLTEGTVTDPEENRSVIFH